MPQRWMVNSTNASRNTADVGFRDAVDGHGPDGGEDPLLFAAEVDLEERAGEQVEEHARDLLVLLGHVLAEIHGELVLVVRDVRQILLDLGVQVVRLDEVEFLLRQGLHGGDVGQGLVAARLGHQGHVIAGAQVPVVVGQVDDLQLADFLPFLAEEIVVHGDELYLRDPFFPVAGILHHAYVPYHFTAITLFWLWPG